MTIALDFGKLASFRPNYKSIRSPGNLTDFPKGWEPCGAQMSVALHRSGYTLDGKGYPCKECAKTTPRYLTYNGVVCIISVPEYYWYLLGRYKEPDVYTGGEAAMRKAIAGRAGIILFGWRHIDLWLDDGLNDKSAPYSMQYLFNNDSIKRRGLFFWECEWATDMEL